MKLQHKMKTKSFVTFLLTAFLVLTSFALVSAAVSFSGVPGSITLIEGANSTSFTITATNSSALINLALSATTINLNGATVTPTISPSTLSNFNSSQVITFTVAPDWSKLTLGNNSYTGTLLVSNTGNASDNSTATINLQKTYCNYGARANGTTRYLDLISVKDTSSDNDWKWKPADEVAIDVKVRYTNTADDEDSIDALITLELYDTQTNSIVDFDSESDDVERSVSLDEGSQTTETFNMIIPTEDLVDSSGRYVLYVKVYEDGRESTLCQDKIAGSEYFKPLEINKESYDISLKNIEVSTPVPCGQEMTIDTKVMNLGSNDEDKVYVKAFSKELGLNLNSSVFALDEGSTNRLVFSYAIPKNQTAKTYDIYLTSFYRYSKSDKDYDKSQEFTATIKVEACNLDVRNASITADFSSETPKALIGNQVIIEATIKNSGNALTTYTIDIVGDSSWLTKSTIDPKTFTLNAGESKKVNLYLDISEDAVEGSKEFTINTGYGSQKVQLTLEKGLTSQSIVNHFKRNWLVYTIVLINLILIIAIIVAVRSIMRK